MVNLLLVLHLEYFKSFGADNQIGKAEKAKGKYETDQKNRKVEISRKRKT